MKYMIKSKKVMVRDECGKLIVPGEYYLRDQLIDIGFGDIGNICRYCVLEEDMFPGLNRISQRLPKVVTYKNLTIKGTKMYADTKKFGRLLFVARVSPFNVESHKNGIPKDIPAFGVWTHDILYQVDKLIALNKKSLELLSQLKLMGVKEINVLKGGVR